MRDPPTTRSNGLRSNAEILGYSSNRMDTNNQWISTWDGKSMRRPKTLTNYDVVRYRSHVMGLIMGLYHVLCEIIRSKVIPLHDDIQTLNQDIQTMHLKQKEHMHNKTFVDELSITYLDCEGYKHVDMNADHEEEVKALQQTISDECRT
eukprot:472051_1